MYYKCSYRSLSSIETFSEYKIIDKTFAGIIWKICYKTTFHMFDYLWKLSFGTSFKKLAIQRKNLMNHHDDALVLVWENS